MTSAAERRATRILAAIAVAAAALACVTASRRPVGNDPEPPVVHLDRTRFEGDFEAELRAAPADRWLTALVDLTEQVDLRTLGIRLRGAGKRERRDAVVGALEAVADRAQAGLRPTLERLLDAGDLGYWHGVAIVDRVVVEARPAALLTLADAPGVAVVRPDWSSAHLPGPGRGRRNPLAVPPRVDAAPLGERFRSWALDAIGAPALWSRGLDGTGVVVAAIDTGVYADHEQLAGRMAPGGRGWYDPVRAAARPYDSHGHGTSVLAEAVGGNPAGRVVGVAPGATWAMALGNFRNLYSRSRMTLAADWILRVARPDVLVNAWSHDEGACGTFDLGFIDAWKASGIFVVFPAGNAGPGEATGESPADLSGAYPDGRPVFSVGGLAPDLSPHTESSRGPSRCGSATFPRIAAPGARLPFAFPPTPGNYGSGDGTSLAAGIVGGAAALLLQADPELSPDEIEDVLQATARDLDPPGEDEATGAGLIDLPAALAEVRRLQSRRTRRPEVR